MVYDKMSLCQNQRYKLAGKLNLPSSVFIKMDIRMDGDVFCFPMYNAQRQIIGIKKRNLNGRKWCVRHSKLGIYLPRHFSASQGVYICEGESDTAAMLSKGYNAIGRASATSCKAILRELLKDCPEITIISDYDPHGLGYKESCKLAKVFERHVHIVLNRDYKDIREWINSGTFTHQKLVALSCF